MLGGQLHTSWSRSMQLGCTAGELGLQRSIVGLSSGRASFRVLAQRPDEPGTPDNSYRRSGQPRRGGENYRRSSNNSRGGSYENKNRRKGRPAWQRSPDDTPLRDGNRDRLVGLLTERSAKTLAYYLSETNLHVYHWLSNFMKHNPIPRDGAWDDVSGETFLRKLLSMQVDEAKYDTGRDKMFDCTGSVTVDPRQLAQRIMDIRMQVAQEFSDDLRTIGEENSGLLRETLSSSLSLDIVVVHPIDMVKETEVETAGPADTETGNSDV